MYHNKIFKLHCKKKKYEIIKWRFVLTTSILRREPINAITRPAIAKIRENKPLGRLSNCYMLMLYHLKLHFITGRSGFFFYKQGLKELIGSFLRKIQFPNQLITAMSKRTSTYRREIFRHI